MADGTAGEFTHTAGKWFGDAEADKGIQTGPDARFYAISADMGKTVSNEGKSLVVQVSRGAAAPDHPVTSSLHRRPPPSRSCCETTSLVGRHFTSGEIPNTRSLPGVF